MSNAFVFWLILIAVCWHLHCFPYSLELPNSTEQSESDVLCSPSISNSLLEIVNSIDMCIKLVYYVGFLDLRMHRLLRHNLLISWNDQNIVQIMHEFLLQFTVPIVINVTPYKVEDHMDKVVTEGDRSF